MKFSRILWRRPRPKLGCGAKERRTLCVAFQQVFIVIVYFIIDSVRKLLDTLSYFIISCDVLLEVTRYSLGSL
jgi:hypothetical protein